MKFIIDGQEFNALPDETIMEAAKRQNVFIPGFCYNEATEHTNCCRMCMVETNDRGREKLVAACAFKVKEGLIVSTTTERVKRIRKTLMKLMYSQAPDNLAIMNMMKQLDAKPEPRLPTKTDQCILCGLCVQNCKALGSSAINTIDRGIKKKVDTPYGEAALICIGCASCADVCPTNCIDVKDSEEGREIWNKKFKWQRCEECGVIITTKEHWEASSKEEDSVLCPRCRKRHITDVFAEDLGE